MGDVSRETSVAMEALSDPLRTLDWLKSRGVSSLQDLNPCVPGEFTLSDTYYVNTATPEIVYRGKGEGTLPLTSGRWYLIPGDLVASAPGLTRDAVPVARAVSLSRELEAMS
jgi:hypothetical protein